MIDGYAIWGRGVVRNGRGLVRRFLTSGAGSGAGHQDDARGSIAGGPGLRGQQSDVDKDEPAGEPIEPARREV